MYPSYIAAVIAVSEKLEGTFFGLEEIAPGPVDSVAFVVTIEVGPSWVICKPKKVTYWVIRDSEGYPGLDEEESDDAKIMRAEARMV